MSLRYFVAAGCDCQRPTARHRHAAATQAQAAGGMGKQRADAFFKALASGDPDAFEAMANKHYTPETLARRTPAERRQMVERFKADFGQLTLGEESSRRTAP